MTALRRACEADIARFGEHLDDAALRVRRRQAGRARDEAHEMRAIVGRHLLPAHALHQDAACFGANVGGDRLQPPLRTEQAIELIGEEAWRTRGFARRRGRVIAGREVAAVAHSSPTLKHHADRPDHQAMCAVAEFHFVGMPPARSSAPGRPDSRRA